MEIHELENRGKSRKKAKKFFLQPAALTPTKEAKLRFLQTNSSPALYACCLRIPWPRSRQQFLRNNNIQPQFILQFKHLWCLEQPQFRFTNTTFDFPIRTNFTVKLLIDTLMQEKQIIALIFWFERRGKPMLMAKNRNLEFSERKVSNWLSKTNQIQWGNLIFE